MLESTGSLLYACPVYQLWHGGEKLQGSCARWRSFPPTSGCEYSTVRIVVVINERELTQSHPPKRNLLGPITGNVGFRFSLIQKHHLSTQLSFYWGSILIQVLPSQLKKWPQGLSWISLATAIGGEHFFSNSTSWHPGTDSHCLDWGIYFQPWASNDVWECGSLTAQDWVMGPPLEQECVCRFSVTDPWAPTSECIVLQRDGGGIKTLVPIEPLHFTLKTKSSSRLGFSNGISK